MGCSGAFNSPPNLKGLLWERIAPLAVFVQDLPPSAPGGLEKGFVFSFVLLLWVLN